MEQRTITLLFALLRSGVCGNSLMEQEKVLYTVDSLPELVVIAKKHDVAHLLALGLKNNALIGKDSKSVENEIFKAVYRYEQLNYELAGLCEVLETAQIPFLPLKGSVIRRFYPEPWMRTSCDIDVLVREEDLEKAVVFLTDTNMYTCQGKGSHDVSFFTNNGNHIELHYGLVEDGRANAASEVLRTVWEMAVLRDGYSYWYEMPDEMFYFYHIAHMAKHFENGGCGIRPFIDLWILDRMEGADQSRRNELLKKGSLLRFAESARKLSKIWFANEEADGISQQMGAYILRGGVYGTSENRITVQQQKKGGRLKYALSKIFIPYDTIRFHYPILQKHRWLTPVMEVRRWCKLAFSGHAKRTMRELKFNSSISKEEAVRARELLRNIGL